MGHRALDVNLTDSDREILKRARRNAIDACERGDVTLNNAWELVGLPAFIAGRDFATVAQYDAAKSFFRSGR